MAETIRSKIQSPLVRTVTGKPITDDRPLARALLKSADHLPIAGVDRGLGIRLGIRLAHPIHKDPVLLGLKVLCLVPVSAPEFDGLIQDFLHSARPKMPALCGHFCFFRFLLLADQATFSPLPGRENSQRFFTSGCTGFKIMGDWHLAFAPCFRGVWRDFLR